MSAKTETTHQENINRRTISDDTILKISKEIAVKFIEVGRLTPSTFNDTFSDIHKTIEDIVRKND